MVVSNQCQIPDSYQGFLQILDMLASTGQVSPGFLSKTILCLEAVCIIKAKGPLSHLNARNTVKVCTCVLSSMRLNNETERHPSDHERLNTELEDWVVGGEVCCALNLGKNLSIV